MLDCRTDSEILYSCVISYLAPYEAMARTKNPVVVFRSLFPVFSITPTFRELIDTRALVVKLLTISLSIHIDDIAATAIAKIARKL
jgi:hypothetical protein